MATTAVQVGLHRPAVGGVVRHRTGAIRVEVGDYPVDVTLFFEDLDAAEDFVLALGREIVALRNTEVTS